jgi:TonB family protein
MAVVSATVHVVVIALAFVAPGGWFGASAPEARSVMTISLGGSRGPQTGGMNQIGGRPVQEVTPPDAPPRPEPIRPPAAKPPEMTVPAPDAPRRPSTPAPPVTQAPDGATGRTPTRGAQTQAGSAIAATGATGQGTGLSSAGGGGGDGLQLDVASFCCPDYLREMTDRIRTNWNDRQGMSGRVVVKFTIHRDGRLTDIEVVEPSFQALNFNAQRAVALAKQLRPLPLEFPNDTLGVRLTFEYER